MSQSSQGDEIFTGLILLTGSHKPDIAQKLFETLAPFSTSILDIDQIVIHERIILTVLLSLSPAHQGAVEADLALLADQIEVDIACLFSHSTPPHSTSQATLITVQADRLHPKTMALLTSSLKNLGGEIGGVRRVSLDPLTISVSISGLGIPEIRKITEEITITQVTDLKVMIEKE